MDQVMLIQTSPAPATMTGTEWVLNKGVWDA